MIPIQLMLDPDNPNSIYVLCLDFVWSMALNPEKQEIYLNPMTFKSKIFRLPKDDLGMDTGTEMSGCIILVEPGGRMLRADSAQKRLFVGGMAGRIRQHRGVRPQIRSIRADVEMPST